MKWYCTVVLIKFKQWRFSPWQSFVYFFLFFKQEAFEATEKSEQKLKKGQKKTKNDQKKKYKKEFLKKQPWWKLFLV